MTPLAYWHHASFTDHIVDLVVRGVVWRTIAVATRGIGLVPMLLIAAVVIGLAFMWNRRRSW